MGYSLANYHEHTLSSMIRNAPDGEIHDDIDGQPLHLSVDSETNSIRIARSPVDAKVIHTFWFAWVAFHPDTDIYTPK